MLRGQWLFPLRFARDVVKRLFGYARRALNVSRPRSALMHPDTALYIGYTNRMENVAIDPVARGLRFTGSPDTVTNRQVFVKVSYLLRF
jgi:hypothetical protein